MTEFFIKLKIKIFFNDLFEYFKTDLVEKHKNDFYALDIFEPEKLVKNCRILAAIFILITIASLLFISSLFHNHLYIFIFLPFQLLSIVLTIFLYPYYFKFILDLVLTIKKNEKNSKINYEFYSALCMLSGFAKGGIPLSEAIKILSLSKLDEIKKEFAKISTNLFVHGMDLKTAILKVAILTKNEKLSYFLRGLANYIEEKKDYSMFVENFLQIDNINRKIELATYSDKMKNMASIFVAMLTACITVAIMSVTSTEAYMRDLAFYIVYLGIPISSFLSFVMIHVGNPIKEKKKEKNKEAVLLSFTCTAIGIMAAYLSFLELDFLKMYLVTLSLFIAAFAYVYTFNTRRKESKITAELDSFLMKLRAAAETRSNFLTAIEKETTIGKEIAPIITASQVQSAEEVLAKSSEKVTHPFLSLVLYVLSAVIHKTRKISDIILTLIYEYHRYVELLKVRKAVFNISIVFSIMCVIIIAICMGILKYQFIPTVEKFASYINYDIKMAKNIAEDSIILIASTSPITFGAVAGDFRRCFSLFLFFLSIAIVFLMY